MRILVTGQGAREHALCSTLSKSPKVRNLYASFNNLGITLLEKVIPIAPVTPENLTDVLRHYAIDYAVIGPEQDLVSGVREKLHQYGIPTIGPNIKATQLESSKSFFKHFATQHQLPQANYRIAYSEQEALDHLKGFNLPLVLKKDELSSGKGSVICHSYLQAQQRIRSWYAELKDRTIILEQFIAGQEVSIIALINKSTLFMLPISVDYKAVGNGHLGPNTGGMGAYSFGMPPSGPCLSLVNKMSDALLSESITYCGFLYLGGIIEYDTHALYLLECNTRLGDPEAQSLLSRMDSDLSTVFEHLLSENTSEPLRWKTEASISIVITNTGYPTYTRPTHRPMLSILTNHPPGIDIFSYASRREADRLYTGTGRIVSLTTLGASLYEARDRIYRHLKAAYPLGQDLYYREDIALPSVLDMMTDHPRIRDLLS